MNKMHRIAKYKCGFPVFQSRRMISTNYFEPVQRTKSANVHRRKNAEHAHEFLFIGCGDRISFDGLWQGWSVNPLLD